MVCEVLFLDYSGTAHGLSVPLHKEADHTLVLFLEMDSLVIYWICIAKENVSDEQGRSIKITRCQG